MGALPKKKRTRARIGPRQLSYRIVAPNVSPCPQCHNPKRPHRVCPSCGYYRGQEIIVMEKESETN